MIKIEKILNGKLLEFCYFIHEENDKIGFCIDPGYDTETIIETITKNEYVVSDILLTHAHFDHMLSCAKLVEKYNSKIYISEIDSKILYNADQNYANLIGKTDFDKLNIEKFVSDGDILNICGVDIKCISTPGHTKGGMSYYIENMKTLFSGDTLFFEVYGRTDLYSGDLTDIINSIKKLFLLPDNTKVFPGHGDTTTIGYEKAHNEIRSLYEL